MEIEIRQLRILHAVAEAGSLTHAANALGMHQGSLSRQLQRLERAAGMPLVQRHQTGVTLTTAGELLLSRADMVLPIVDRLLVEARQHNRSGGAPTMMRIGSVPTPVLPELVRQADELRPGAQISVQVEDSSALLAELLCQQQLDLAVLREHPDLDVPPTAGVEYALIAEESVFLALAAGHRLSRRTSLTLADLADEQVVLADAATHRLSRHFMSVCTVNDLRPRICYASDAAAVAALAFGAAAVAPTYVTGPDPGLVYRQLREPGLCSRLLLAWTPDTPLATALPPVRTALADAHADAVRAMT